MRPIAPRRWHGASRICSAAVVRTRSPTASSAKRRSWARSESLCEAAADARDAAGERAAALERSLIGSARVRRTTSPTSFAPARARRPSCRRSCAAQPTPSPRPRFESPTSTIAAPRPRPSWRGSWRRSGASSEPISEPLSEDERLEIDSKLERLARRREQLGPVNPLAEREYEEALAHVESLETQRTDLETALSELGGLIRETDRKIHAAFEETFEQTQQNFTELVEHLFPGGRGRLRLVDDARGPKPVLGGADRADDADRIEPRSEARPRRTGTSSRHRASRSR